MFKVIASFENSAGQPLTGADYSVGLRDEDRFFDDKLGVSRLGPEGTADFIIYSADFLSLDSRGERQPDLYFVLEKGGEEIFRSEVFPDVDFDFKDPVTGRAKGLTKSFGPFRVDAL